LAERIRALGGYPVGTMEGFLKIATLKEETSEIPAATGMVARLVDNHEHIVRYLRQHVDQCSDDYHDEGTADFLTNLMEEHEEMAWILRSFIEGRGLEPDGKQPKVETQTPVGV